MNHAYESNAQDVWNLMPLIVLSCWYNVAVHHKGWHASMQVIPAGQTAMFPITMLNMSSRAFYHNVDVVLNGSHVLKFAVQADVIDPAVRLSHTDLDFALSAQDWLNHCDKVILMENHQAVPSPYEWCNPMPGVFKVAPLSGCIPPYSSSEALVRWAPPLDSSNAGPLLGHAVACLLLALSFLNCPTHCCH